MGYIVMLYSHDYKKQLPLVDLEDDIVVFESEAEARKAGESNIIGEVLRIRDIQELTTGPHRRRYLCFGRSGSA